MDSPLDLPSPDPLQEVPSKPLAPIKAADFPTVEPPMILIPGGTFTMGSISKFAEPNETPIHAVTLSPYWMDRTEVTVGAYRTCMEEHRCSPLAPPPSKRCTFALGDDLLPINCVSFVEAEHFCLAHGKRLPTEAEWELAARGFVTRIYPWGQKLPTCKHAISRMGNLAADGCGEGPAPVGKRAAGKSPFGLLDMAGNVEEWVSDFYDDRHVIKEHHDPQGAASSTAHVLRGGSWASPWRHLRVSFRSWGSSMEHGSTVGFRCAMSYPTRTHIQ